jgi:hypothetical protein
VTAPGDFSPIVFRRSFCERTPISRRDLLGAFSSWYDAISDGSTGSFVSCLDNGICRYLRSRQSAATLRHRQASQPHDRCFFPVPRHNIHIPDARTALRLRRVRRGIDQQGGDTMRRQLAALAGSAFVVTSGAALAHHSFAMFDQENPIELQGVVKEFKFTSPHTFIIIEIKQQDGSAQLWSLEGGAPSALVRDGWSSKTLKPGDEL